MFFRTLLLCYPAAFRHEYAAEMMRTFDQQLREARRSGGWAAVAMIRLRAVADTLETAPGEHLHVLRQDLMQALRSLSGNPGFTAVAILSLALGIGANTAIFSLLNSVLMRTLPVRDAHELVMLTNPASAGVFIGSQNNERSLLSHSEFRQLAETGMFTSLMAAQSNLDRVRARVDGSEEEIGVRMVSGTYFQTLGVPARLGRVFSEAEDVREGAAPYAVISDAYWRRRFGGSAGVLGRRISIRKGVFEVIGVAPPEFFGETVGQRPDVWIPLSMQGAVLPGRDWLHDAPGKSEKVMWLQVFGRLRPPMTLEQAEARANVIFQQGLAAYYGSALKAETRKQFLDQRLKLRPAAYGASQLRGQFAEPLWMLLAAAATVLLIACANLGNLLLTQATARGREIAVRLALGASRGRLIRQLLTESMTLAVFGGLAGLAAAVVMRAGLLRLVSDTIELPVAADARVLGFSFALTLATGLILGLLPALRTTSVEAGAGLKEQGRGVTGSAKWARVGKLVVVGQLALSLPLLVAAGLLVGTLYRLQNVDLGYSKDRLLMVRVDAVTGGYEEQRRLAMFQELYERIRLIPGVRTVAYSENGLFSGPDSADEVDVEGYVKTGKDDFGSRYDHVGPGYFSALGIPILLGREVTEQDQASSNKVCVINESFAARFFAGRNPIGMHVTQVYGDQRNTFEVVGVARDARSNNVRGEVGRRFYVPLTQPVNAPDSIGYAIRTAGDPAGMAETVRRAIREFDPSLPVTGARPVAEYVSDRLNQDRLLARLSAAFGVVALLLTAIGLYGVLSYGVTRRTNEIGLRMALGAGRSAVLRMIARETGWLLLAGAALGTAAAVGGTQWIASRLYGLERGDPLVYGSAVCVLLLAAGLAAAIPALRASRVDPLVALRHE